MTVYDKLMENMTPETLAELGVRLVSLNNNKLYYMTSTKQLFDYDKYIDALNHEYKWLLRTLDQEPSTEQDN